MSMNTEIVASLQGKIAESLLPLIKAAESAQVDLAGEMIDVPQQAQARLKQKVNQEVVACRTLLNQIQIS